MIARILIADDHAVVRKGLRALIEAHPHWSVCGEVANGRDAIRMAGELTPDIAVLDISMPGLNGLDALEEIGRSSPGTKVLMLTMHYNEEFVERSLKAGARGYLLKSDAEQDLVAAINALLQDKTFLTAPASEMLVERFIHSPAISSDDPLLTTREREVLQLIAEGHTNKEIAGRLCVSLRTVETHRAHIMSKLNVDSVADLVRYAIRNKFVET